MKHNHIDFSRPVTFMDALLLMFIALKLTGHIDWGWVWVLSPLWLTVVTVFWAIVIHKIWKDKKINKGRKQNDSIRN